MSRHYMGYFTIETVTAQSCNKQHMSPQSHLPHPTTSATPSSCDLESNSDYVRPRIISTIATYGGGKISHIYIQRLSLRLPL